jgi:hypothetical protein
MRAPGFDGQCASRLARISTGKRLQHNSDSPQIGKTESGAPQFKVPSILRYTSLNCDEIVASFCFGPQSSDAHNCVSLRAIRRRASNLVLSPRMSGNMPMCSRLSCLFSVVMAGHSVHFGEINMLCDGFSCILMRTTRALLRSEFAMACPAATEYYVLAPQRG